MSLNRLSFLLSVIVLSVAVAAHADTHLVEVACIAPSGLTAIPDPVFIHKGDAVQWTFSMSCMVPCNVAIPAQPGYAGWAANGGDWQNPLGPCPPFNVLGNYTYTVTQNPSISCSIVVSDGVSSIPTLSEWAMIVFSILLLVMMTYFLARRRNAAYMEGA